MNLRLRNLIFSLAVLFPCLCAHAVDYIPENSRCDVYTFNKEIKIYKDPDLFRERFRQFSLEDESPFLVARKGAVKLVVGEAQPFKGFEKFKRLMPKSFRTPNNSDLPDIRVIRFCGQGDPYEHAPGFVFDSDFEKAQEDVMEVGQLPPSNSKRFKLPKSISSIK